MAKREYKRRTDEELINDLEGRIEALKTRVQSQQRPDAPVLKEVTKVKRTLAKFSQTCVDHGRTDLANSVMAFMHTLEHQSKTPPASVHSR